MQLWCCRSQQMLLLRRKQTLVRTDTIPQVVQENLDLHIKIHHNQHRQWRGNRKISNGKGSLGQGCLLVLLSKWTMTLWNWRGCCHAMSSWLWVFNIVRIALLMKQWNFLLFKKKKANSCFGAFWWPCRLCCSENNTILWAKKRNKNKSSSSFGAFRWLVYVEQEPGLTDCSKLGLGAVRLSLCLLFMLMGPGA